MAEAEAGVDTVALEVVEVLFHLVVAIVVDTEEVVVEDILHTRSGEFIGEKVGTVR